LKRRGQTQDIVGPVVFHQFDGKPVPFCNGAKKTNITVFTVGPHVVPGTNGPAISKDGLREPVIDQPQSNGSSASQRVLNLRRLSEIEAKETEWLWKLRIPLGELTVLDGNPGDNKSSLLLDLAARVSTGRGMADETSGVKGGVLLLLGEDSIAKTVLRRLEVAGADLTSMAVLDQSILLPRNNKELVEAAVEVKAKLIIFDPLMAFLGPDSNSDQKVRTALSPLAAIAEKTNAAIVMVRHLNKRGGGHSLYRGSGSIGIIAATRSGLMIGRSPDNPDLRVLCHVKNNLGRLAPSLLFEPVDVDGVPQIEWRGECDYTADDLLTSAKQNAARLAEAMMFLNDTLAEGPVEQAIIKQRAVVGGMAYRTVERAKEVLGVISDRDGWGPGSKCLWRLQVEDNPIEEVPDETHRTPTILAWRSMDDAEEVSDE
jgi:DNA repair protein RadA/Sms